MIRHISLLLMVCLLWPSVTRAQLGGGRFQGYPALDKPNHWSALQTFSAGLTVSAGNLIAPTIIGGTGTTSTLTLQSTSGVGTTGADIIFKVGNNGATEAGRILNNGYWGIGISPSFPLEVNGQFRVDRVGVASQYIDLNGDATVNRILSSGAKPFRIYTDAAYNMQLGVNGITPSLTIDGTNAFVVLGGPTSAASLLDLRAGDLTMSGANGQKFVVGRATQLVAVGSGISTKATTIQIPADAIVYAVPVYVKTQPGGTDNFTVTATTSGTAFQKGANISTAAGTSDPGTKNTPINYNSVAAQTVTFTFNAATTDALGEIRIDIYYATSTPPTS